MAVAELSRARGEARFCGVGNAVASLLIGAASRTMVSQNGTAGAEARRIQEFSYPWPADALLVMHTDGLSAQWQLPKYSGLRFRHPALVAAVLYRDFRRVRDDATVLVVRDAVSSLAAAPPPPPGSIA